VPGWFDDAVIYGAIPVIVALGVLLNLATTTTWSSIATVAVIVLIRKMVTRSVARSAGPRPVTPGGQSPG
jgi:hypothetical protein